MKAPLVLALLLAAAPAAAQGLRGAASQPVEADVFLAQHPDISGMDEKLARLKAGAPANPFVDPEGYRRVVEQAERNYLRQLDDERAARR